MTTASNASLDNDDRRALSTAGLALTGRDRIVGLLCAYASESLHATERWATAHNIHQTDVRALAELGQAQRAGTAMTAGQLGVAIGLSSPATSALIARLEDAGNIVRTRDPEDRRRVLLSASPQAQRGAAAYFQPMGDAVTAALANCSEEDMGAIDSFLERLVREMRARPAK
jgi:DNA-binding MarR family transcriptional regulator